MPIKELILICYLLCMVLGVSGLTIALLARNRKNTRLNKSLALFIIAMLIICAYDMTIYYCDYVIGEFNSPKVMRIGNCIIAGVMYTWICLQEQIINRQALQFLNRMVKSYSLFYLCMWLLLTIFLGISYFYTIKWLLLATDIILILLFLAAAVAHIIFAATVNSRYDVYHMLVVSAMIIWNYVSYFWGETSVYWGNSAFIREPLDLTIFFWLIINALTIVFAYRVAFVKAFDIDNDDESGKRDIKERIDEVCEQYKLTRREREFIDLIYAGKSNKEIAEILFLSESTVKTHIYNIFRKMDAKNRVSVICIINGDVENAEE